MKTITLRNGVDIPQLGYGVYQISPEECEMCVLDALNIGYRLIDTAQAYHNEAPVGRAVKASGIPRNEIFIVSKIWISNYSKEKAAASIDKSLKHLQTDYIDLMLLHQPFCDRYAAYRALEEAYTVGKVRAIGVSNFYPDHFIDLASNMEIAPMVNQIETHVFDQEVQEQKLLKEYGCALMSWAPLAEGKHQFFSNPVLREIGSTHGKTVAQVALRWLIQRGIIAIPKSVRRTRMEENFDIFDFSLTQEEMATISGLDTGKSLFFDHHDGKVAKQFMEWRSLV